MILAHYYGPQGFPDGAVFFQRGIPGPAGPAAGPRGRTGASGPVPQDAGFPAGPSPALTPVAKVRQEFPEAWIWIETSAG